MRRISVRSFTKTYLAVDEFGAEDATFLEKLAKGLKMGGEEVVSAADINSVPDVWARVLIVRIGLVDGSKSKVDEWRGTLA